MAGGVSRRMLGDRVDIVMIYQAGQPIVYGQVPALVYNVNVIDAATQANNPWALVYVLRMVIEHGLTIDYTKMGVRWNGQIHQIEAGPFVVMKKGIPHHEAYDLRRFTAPTAAAAAEPAHQHRSPTGQFATAENCLEE